MKRASTTLTNATNKPSPLVLTMRPSMLGDRRLDDLDTGTVTG
jgi:hypothetical protein